MIKQHFKLYCYVGKLSIMPRYLRELLLLFSAKHDVDLPSKTAFGAMANLRIINAKCSHKITTSHILITTFTIEIIDEQRTAK